MKSFILLLLFIVCCTGCKHSDNAGPVNTCPALSTSAVENITIFPPTHPLNTAIDATSIDEHSDAIMQLIASGGASIKADFGSGLYNNAPIGIPFIPVCKDQQKTTIVFRGNDYDDNYGSQSDAGPYPIPLTAPIEGNGSGDSHVIAVDIDNKMLYELYNANVSGNNWEASGGSVFDLSVEAYRPEGWTSADAAGLPIFPLLVRYDEVASGTIDHAIRFTLSKAKVARAYVHPARHLVSGTNSNANAPTPMGMRLRLKKDFNITGYSASNQVILAAMKKYGIILADIGSDFYISGAPDERWNNDDLQLLKNVKGSDFEVITLGNIYK